MKVKQYEIIFINYRIFNRQIQQSVNIIFHKSKTIYGAYRRFRLMNHCQNNILIKIRKHNPERDYKKIRSKYGL